MHVGRMDLHLFTLKIFALTVRHCGSGDGGDCVLVNDEERWERERGNGLFRSVWWVLLATRMQFAIFFFGVK